LGEGVARIDSKTGERKLKLKLLMPEEKRRVIKDKLLKRGILKGI
jgi:hypothetical protein